MKAITKFTLTMLSATLAILFISACRNDQVQQDNVKRDINFNGGWKFLNEGIEEASAADFDDSQWRTVDLPHDISVEDLPFQDSLHLGPFFKGVDPSGDAGFLTGGTAWYRKHFVLDKKDKDKQVIINFDGVQSEAAVFVNGIKVEEHKYGYTPINVDITDYLAEAGSENVIALKVVNPERNSRWFAGFGIYRDVVMSVLNPVHINDLGVFITTPKVGKEEALVNLDIQLSNAGDIEKVVTLRTEIISPGNTTVKSKNEDISLSPNSISNTTLEFDISNPVLWELNSPGLYTARLSILENGNLVDEYFIDFGIRSLDFSAENGFLLNGKNVLLKGACLHHDNGLLGAAAFERAEYRRVEIMKKNGFNAIRTSHNPPSKLFLKACDELGMLVIDEAFDMWKQAKRENDYHLYFEDNWETDIESMILRDRNHPSIIMWSYGNEIPERAREQGIETGTMLVNKIKSLDNTRLTTQAICHFWDNPDQNWEEHTPAAFEVMDIAGYNYRYDYYESDHKLFPDRIMYGSESVPKEAFANWKMVEKHSYVIGDFVWTGMDYLGESGIGRSQYKDDDVEEWMPLPGWPWYNAWCGDIDLIGNKKPQSLFRDVLWNESALEILVHEPIPRGKFEHISYWGWQKESAHWNWQGSEGDTLLVNVYSSYPKVRLELNGEYLGEQEVNLEKGITATFNVPYQEGEIKAIGIRNGESGEIKTLKSTGSPSKLDLIAERSSIVASRNEIVYINVSVLDNENNVVPTSAMPVEIEISGEGELLAAGNANPFIQGSLQDNSFNLFNGRGLIIIRSNGKKGNIYLKVDAGNKLSQEIQIETTM